jgi:hypothetical protein
MLLQKHNLQNVHCNEDKALSYHLGFQENKDAHKYCTHFHKKIIYDGSHARKTLFHSNGVSSNAKSEIGTQGQM